MITPFQRDGEVDWKALGTITDRLIRNGVSYLVALGTTAETPVLSREEKAKVIRNVVDTSGGRVPVVVGVGGNDTRGVVDHLRGMEMKGISGVLSVTPYYNKPTQEGMYQHFAAVAAVAGCPVILYNVPGRTGSNLSAETTLRLASDFQGSIVAVKEASGNFDQVMEIIRNRPDGFSVISGDDGITLPMIACGGDGVISVIGNAYPALLSTLVSAALDGAYGKAREIHYRLLPMMRAIFREGNPTGVKAAMEIQGIIDNVLRLPLIPATEKLYAEIRELDAALR